MTLILLLILVTAKPETALTKDETQVVESVNKFRAKYKLPPLTVSPTLMRVARYRVPHYTHNWQGRWMWDEAKRFGYKGFATDNLAQGQTSPQMAVDDWAHSSVGHARQLLGQRKLNGKWEEYGCSEIGVAHNGSNWIAIFGSKGK